MQPRDVQSNFHEEKGDLCQKNGLSLLMPSFKRNDTAGNMFKIGTKSFQKKFGEVLGQKISARWCTRNMFYRKRPKNGA